jgi:hypothetical protein
MMRQLIVFLAMVFFMAVFISKPLIGQPGSVKIEGFELVGKLPKQQHSELWDSKASSLSPIFAAVKEDENLKLLIYVWRNRTGYLPKFRSAENALDGGAAVALGIEAKQIALEAGVPEERIDPVHYREDDEKAGVEFMIKPINLPHSHPTVPPVKVLDDTLSKFMDEQDKKWEDQALKDTEQDRRLDSPEFLPRFVRIGLGGGGLIGGRKIRDGYRPDIAGASISITFCGELGYVTFLGFGRTLDEGYWERFGTGLVGLNLPFLKWLSIFGGYGIGGGNIELDTDKPLEKHHGFILGMRVMPNINNRISLDLLTGFMADQFRLAKPARELSGIPGERKFDYKAMPTLVLSGGLTFYL